MNNTTDMNTTVSFGSHPWTEEDLSQMLITLLVKESLSVPLLEAISRTKGASLFEVHRERGDKIEVVVRSHRDKVSKVLRKLEKKVDFTLEEIVREVALNPFPANLAASSATYTYPSTADPLKFEYPSTCSSDVAVG